MDKFEQIIRSAISSESVASQPPGFLAEKILIAIENKRRFYVLAKLIIYSFSTLFFLVGLILIWQAEKINIINSPAVNLLSLLFSDFAVVVSYWQDYALSLIESFPVVSVVAVAVFVWAVCASLWMTVRTYFLFTHRFIKRIQA
ncbi:MAG TPA: hypothetical protein VLK22_03995 [Candidatus Udaeobacter sp.]|nr:hypothetical protein [Candidatus Udaeobacter sp.]